MFHSLDSNIYLCVDPELIQEIKLYVNGKDGGRNNESHGNVENLGREEEIHRSHHSGREVWTNIFPNQIN